MTYQEKEKINKIIFKKIKVKNLAEAYDIPDFKSNYGKIFVNIALNRFLKEILKEEYFVRVISGSRYLKYKDKNLLINYFPIGSLPSLDFNHNQHLIVGYNLGKNKIYIFGELDISFNNKKEFETFKSNNTLSGGNYFYSFELLKPFIYD